MERHEEILIDLRDKEQPLNMIGHQEVFVVD
jgi:hypothetical protein